MNVKKDNWTAEEITDVRDKIAVVTGGNSGLGKETARVLAQKGAVVILCLLYTSPSPRDRG